MAIRFSVDAKGITRTYDLNRSLVSFGRSHECTVALDDPALSRTHCQIEVEEGQCSVRDLNSRNGTFVSGESVNRVALQANDEVVIGNTKITFLGVSDQLGLETRRPATEKWTDTLFRKVKLKKKGKVKDAALAQAELERLRKLLDINRKIASEMEPERVLETILDHAIEFVGAERGFLVTLESGRLYIPVARDFWRKDIDAPAFEVSRSIALEVVRRGLSVVSADAGNDERFDEMVSVHNLQLRSVLCVPLKNRGEVRGALYLDNRFTGGTFDADDSEALEAFADQAAISLVNSGVYEQVKRVSTRWKQLARQSQRELQDAKAQLAQLERADGLRFDYQHIIGRSEAMRSCLSLVDRVTDTDLSVLLRGESGTGKELIARALHHNSTRRERPFVVVNCAAFSPGLIEAELFGHVKGAFSGGTGKPGLLETADGGTLFLDEVGDMDLKLQQQLLRFLEDGEVRPVGSRTAKQVDVRVVSATSQNIEEKIAAREFREDLLYRLKGVCIELPPLRERLGDIPVLLRHFFDQGSSTVALDESAMKAILAYRWPGNVRQLRNEVQRLMALGDGQVGKADLSADIRLPTSGAFRFDGQTAPLKAYVEDLEIEIIREALRHFDGNKTKVAEALGLSRLGLRKKMARFGIEDS